MALDGDALAALRKSRLITAFGTPVDDAAFESWLKVDSKAIIDYITANNEVTVEVAGVMPGPATVTGEGTFS